MLVTDYRSISHAILKKKPNKTKPIPKPETYHLFLSSERD